MSLKNIIKQSVNEAEQEISKIDSSILSIDGMSSNKCRHLLNNLCNYMEDTRYLEVGTWKGSTLFSAVYKNAGTYIGIDDFSHFGGPRKEFNENLNKFKFSNIKFFDNSCWDVDFSDFPKINVYLYDGKHDQMSQYRAFSHFYEILDDEFIAIVDDWNIPHVRKGTLDSFNDLGFNVTYSWEKLTKINGDKEDFWNGIFVAAVKK